MEFKKVFDLVHGLSSQQRRNFTNYHTNKDTLVYKLFKAILKHTTLDNPAKSKIKDLVTSNSSTLGNTKTTLATQIIKSLVHFEHESSSIIPFVKSAFLFEVPEIGQAALNDEMVDLQSKEDFSSLLRLSYLIEELQSLHGIKLERPPEIFDTILLQQIVQERGELFNSIEEAKSSTHLGANGRKKVANRLSRTVKAEYLSASNKALALKLRVRIAYLEGNIELALTLSEILVDALKKMPNCFPQVFIAKEVRLTALFAMALNNQSISSRYALELSLLDGDSPLEYREIKKSALMLSSVVAATFADINIAENCLVQLEEINVEVPSRIKCYAYYNIGMAFFYNDQHTNAIKCMEEVRNLHSKAFEKLFWEPLVVLAISLFEIGDDARVDSLIRSANRQAANRNSIYPLQAVSLVSKYFNKKNCSNSVFEHGDLLQIEAVLEDNEAKLESNDFPIQLWIRSKLVDSSPQRTLKNLIAVSPKRLDELLFG
jgi:hypothetical protein